MFKLKNLREQSDPVKRVRGREREIPSYKKASISKYKSLTSVQEKDKVGTPRVFPLLENPARKGMAKGVGWGRKVEPQVASVRSGSGLVLVLVFKDLYIILSGWGERKNATQVPH